MTIRNETGSQGVAGHVLDVSELAVLACVSEQQENYKQGKSARRNPKRSPEIRVYDFFPVHPFRMRPWFDLPSLIPRSIGRPRAFYHSDAVPGNKFLRTTPGRPDLAMHRHRGGIQKITFKDFRRHQTQKLNAARRAKAMTVEN